MIDIYSKALRQTIQVDRIINQVTGKVPGPTLIFFAGIHGNEPAGVFALHEVLARIQERNDLLKGTVIGITGNMKALSDGLRYVDTDLNRLWASNGVTKNINENCAEKKEQHELMEQLSKAIKENSGPFYFFDLHTTSGATPPFITINDTLLNRKFSLQFRVPVILGIEEYLSGPLLSYINEWGYVSLGYESGQHDDIDSIKNHKQFITKALQLTGLIATPTSMVSIDHPNYFYEITYRHHLSPGDQFSMCNGFTNFEPIVKGQRLASHNGNWVDAKEDGIIFMPLYQQQGNDGYFLIRKIPLFFLRLSRIIRKMRLDNWLSYLPGIKWKDSHKTTIQVNVKIARFFASDFLHLMGFRVKQKEGHHMLATKRENRLADKAYRHEPWLRSW